MEARSFMAQHCFELSSDPVCDVCGSGAARLHPLIDPCRQIFSACPACAVRVASSLAGFDAQHSLVAARARQVLIALAPM
jgi:hypothetical protein